jgi:hypothetical protein
MTGTMLQPLTELTFTPSTTRPALEAVCEAARLDPAGATVLRHHTNAVYRLASTPVVVKISRPGASNADSTVQLVRWLSLHGVPSVALMRGVQQPLRAAGCDVTLWAYLPQNRPISAGDIAGPLAALHSTAPPLGARRLDPMPTIEQSISQSRCLTDPEKAILRERAHDLSRAWNEMALDVECVLLHGDPQHRNTLWDHAARRAVLCDWESAITGPVEWDLVTIEIHCRRFGQPSAEFDQFCHRYGTDVRDWSGYTALRDIRELKMITSNARKAEPDTPPADEVRRRIKLLDAGPGHRWHIL